MVETAALENLIVLEIFFVLEFVRLLIEMHRLRATAEDVVFVLYRSQRQW